MKKLIILLFILAATGVLTGCSNSHTFTTTPCNACVDTGGWY